MASDEFLCGMVRELIDKIVGVTAERDALRAEVERLKKELAAIDKGGEPSGGGTNDAEIAAATEAGEFSAPPWFEVQKARHCHPEALVISQSRYMSSSLSMSVADAIKALRAIQAMEAMERLGRCGCIGLFAHGSVHWIEPTADAVLALVEKLEGAKCEK